MNKVIMTRETKIKISLIGGTLIFFMFIIYFKYTNMDFLYKLTYYIKGRLGVKLLAMYYLFFIAGVMGIMILTDIFVCKVVNSNRCFVEKK
tara:strand:+ start:5968 stop:6240 length:273 start_codon:yes stop_codon:yes gene_type:complete